MSTLLPDDPEWDCTDFAHPAWWRGEQHGSLMVCLKVLELIKNGDTGGKFSDPRMNEMRDKIAAMRDALERLSRIGCKQGRAIAKQALEEIRSEQPKKDSSV